MDGKDDGEVEACGGVSNAKKRFPGVTKNGNRWWARVRNPMERVDVNLGSYSTPEEAALVVKKKKAEFEALFKGEGGWSMGNRRGHFEGKKLPRGVSWANGRYRVQILDPTSKKNVSGGSYKTCDEAAKAADRKRQELGGKLSVIPYNEGDDEVCNEPESVVGNKSDCSDEQNDDVKIPSGVRRSGKWVARIKKPDSKDTTWSGTHDTLEEAISCYEEKKACGGVSNAKKRFPGVTKNGNRWWARVRNPMERADVYLGSYSTPEEAALVVTKKKAEFEALFKGEGGWSMGNRRGHLKGKKLPRGVSWANGRYRVQIRHPTSKKIVSGGSYKTCDEAAKAADRKRQELGGKLSVNPYNERDGEVFKEPESVAGSKSDCSDEQNDDLKIPSGVRRIKSGKWAARIRNPDSKDTIWLGTYNTLEEAISCYKEKKAEFDAKHKKPEFDWVEFRRGSEATETPMKLECEFGYDSPTSLSDAHDLGSFANGDKSSNGDSGVVDGPWKLGDMLVDSSPTSEFERAVSLGIINEYGQLLGQHSELDEFMGLSLPDENGSDSTGHNF